MLVGSHAKLGKYVALTRFQLAVLLILVLLAVWGEYLWFTSFT